MNIAGTKTELNLAKAFAAEAQDRVRYENFAQTARQEGYYYVAQVFEKLAKEELAHAAQFLEKLNKGLEQPPANINVDTGYPFEMAGTLKNLQASSKHENDLAAEIYPAFAQDARDEGFADIARLFDQVASVESGHSAIETALHTAMSAGKLYTSEFPVKWKCSNCGYEAEQKEPWVMCPLCEHAQGYVIPQAAMAN